ncbi:MAG: DUF6785 family protein, partial [Planctomycetota bacterium]
MTSESDPGVGGGQASAGDPQPVRRAFTVKSILFGIVGAAVVAMLTGFNDEYLEQTSLTGNQFPVFAFGVLFILAVIWNPIWNRIGKRMMLSTGELVVFLSMTLAASWVAGSGLNRYFYKQLILPHQHYAGKAQWQQYRMTEYLPEHLFPLGADPGTVHVPGVGQLPAEDVTHRAFVYQLADGERVEFEQRLQRVTLTVGRQVDGPFDAEAAFTEAVQRYESDGTVRAPALVAEQERISALRERIAAARESGAGSDQLRTLQAEMEAVLEPVTRQYQVLPGGELVPQDEIAFAGVHIDVAGQGDLIVPQVHTYEIVYTDFANGKNDMTMIPWAPWAQTMLVWGPLLIVFAITLVAMMMVVHRQWSRNEQLSYPLAQVGGAMLQRTEGATLPAVFRNRLFWLGFVSVVCIQLFRLFHAWFPDSTPDLKLNAMFGFMWEMVPHGPEAGMRMVHQFHFFFFLFAIAYFVSSEIGLTLGLAQILLMIVGIEFYVASGTQLNEASDLKVMHAGSYIMFGLIILWMGRHYYGSLLKRALGLGVSDNKVSADGVLAARVFLIGFFALWAMITWMIGVDWFMSLIYVLLVMWLLLVFARIITETGMPFMQAIWSPALVMTKLLGFSAVGAGPMVILYFLSTILHMDTRECLTPYAAHAIKIGDDRGIRPRRIAGVAIVAILVAMTAGFGARLYSYYNQGALTTDNFSSQSVPKSTFENSLKGFIWMNETGEFVQDDGGGLVYTEAGTVAEAAPASGLAKLAKWEPDDRAAGFFFAGAIGVALFFFLRLRFAAFPLHP